jgi:muramoyltetrapeptide carboxypeptidase
MFPSLVPKLQPWNGNSKGIRLNKKLPPILPGDKVGLVAPAGAVNKEQIQRGLTTLDHLKIEYEFGKHAFSDKGLVSASVKNRIEDINHFLRWEEIKAIWALRGGYGSMQLLKKFNYSLLEDNPKLFIGFSDLTALQWSIIKKTGTPSLSGLTLTSQLSRENPYVSLGIKMLTGKRTAIAEKDLKKKVQVITSGEAEGILIGGTLAMICSLCGTPYFPDRHDLILFLEDVNEPLYRIARYFEQLGLVNFWSKVRGVILGRFLFEENPLKVASILVPFLPTAIPIISNFPYGHQAKCMPLPQGVSVRFRTDPFQLKWDDFIELKERLV